MLKEFFVYNLHNAEGSACKLVRTERELEKDDMLPLCNTVVECAGWVVGAFCIYRYFDENRLNELAKLWSEPRPDMGLGAQDIKGSIRRPFDANDPVFKDTRWREVFSYDSI